MSVPGEATNSPASSKYLQVTNKTAESFSLAVGAARANTQLQDNASVVFLDEKIEAVPSHLAHARKSPVHLLDKLCLTKKQHGEAVEMKDVQEGKL